MRKATADDLEAVESAVGMGHSAWDTINPREIIEAAWTVYEPECLEAVNAVPYEKPITVEEIERMIHVTKKYGHALKISRVVAWLEAIKRDFTRLADIAKRDF